MNFADRSVSGIKLAVCCSLSVDSWSMVFHFCILCDMCMMTFKHVMTCQELELEELR